VLFLQQDFPVEINQKNETYRECIICKSELVLSAAARSLFLSLVFRDGHTSLGEVAHCHFPRPKAAWSLCIGHLNVSAWGRSALTAGVANSDIVAISFLCLI
jgi:hypothetical protein